MISITKWLTTYIYIYITDSSSSSSLVESMFSVGEDVAIEENWLGL
jgi:hypothetical protein